jgi:hypothetical protein
MVRIGRSGSRSIHFLNLVTGLKFHQTSELQEHKIAACRTMEGSDSDSPHFDLLSSPPKRGKRDDASAAARAMNFSSPREFEQWAGEVEEESWGSASRVCFEVFQKTVPRQLHKLITLDLK